MRTMGMKLLSGLLAVVLLFGGSLVFAPRAEAMRALLFPLITTEAGKFTFINILNDGSSFGVTFPMTLHFTYMTKPMPSGGLQAVDRTAGCAHFDGDGDTTLADAMIFEVGGKVQTDPPSWALFEGAAPATSKAVPLLVGGQVGFLIVSFPAAFDTFLHGWASIVSSADGLAWTYSTDFLTAGFLGDSDPLGDFSRIDGSLGIFADRKFTSWYPTSIVTDGTTPPSPMWYLLPLSAGSTMAPATGGGIRRAIKTSVDHGPLFGTEGAFDLDENFFSGGKTVTIRCLGFFSLNDILQPGVVSATAGGGWFSTVPTSATVGTDTFSPGAYLLYRIMPTHVFGDMKTTINREPAHTPTFCTTPSQTCAGP